MKKLELNQMEEVTGGLTERHIGCGTYGLAAGIASGFNPLVGGLTTLACFLVTPREHIQSDVGATTLVQEGGI